ncbi:MAG: penicillin-binding transpeptidase domain-containing protein [Acidobacteriota bacterium]
MTFNKAGLLRYSLKIISSAFLLFVFIASTFLAHAAPGNGQAKTKKARDENTTKARDTRLSRSNRTDTRVSAKTSDRMSQRAGKGPATDRNRAGNVQAKGISNAPKLIGKSPSKARDQKAEILSKRRTTELARAEARRRAQAELHAAIARKRAGDESMRDYVQAMIAKDDLSGEDPEIRRVAINALGNHAGTVVVMDPKTGRVYSMVNQEWALHEGFKPCSTIKLVTGLAGLNEQLIDSNVTSNISNTTNVSLTRALAYSRNGYFQDVGGQVGFDKMLSYARQFGLGEKTGINMRNESPGSIPNSKTRTGIARMSSHGDDFQVTALQLATLVSAIGNGGKLVVPYVVRSRQDELKFKTKVRRQIRLDSAAWGNMIPGMVGAVNYGSGRKAHDPRQTVAGKTGTCIERGGWVGLFTSYAPLANPRLAVVVIARGADARSHFPAAVAGRIYRDLNGRFGTPTNLQIASTRKTLTTEKFETDDEEKSEATTVSRISKQDRNAMANRTPLVGSKGAPLNSMVKPVLLQIPKRTESPKPQVERTDSAPAGTEGQTRPRRVYIR